MINRSKNLVEWTLLSDELQEAREHLDSLIKDLNIQEDFSEVEFGILLGHIYGHLNRAWNRRDKRGDLTDSEWEKFSQYPSELRPDGTWFPLEGDI